MRVLPLVVTVALLTGCSGLFETDTPPVQAYVLRIDPQQQPAGDPVKGTLRVSHPLAAPGLETERIVLVQSDHRLNFFTASRWASSVPDIVEALAIETLRGTQTWSVVTGSNSGFPGDYNLQITVRRFDADYTENPNAPVVRVALDCVVGRRTDRELLGSFTAEATEPSAENRLAAVVEAFERATNKALMIVAERSAESVRTSKAPSSP
jgi:cholesterol transport system auxiliary component